MLASLRSQIASAARTRYARSVGTLAIGSSAGQAVIILASPILTRLYTPSDFGAFAVYTAILFTLMGAETARYDLAVLLPGDDEDGHTVLVLALLVLAGTCTIVLLASIALSASVAAWTDAPPLAGLLWMLPLSLAGSGTFHALSAWAARLQVFSSVARAHVAQNLVRVLVQVGMALSFPGALGLVTGDAIGRLSGGGALAWGLARRRRLARAWPGWARLRAAAVRFRAFPLLSSWGTVLSYLGVELPVLLLAGLYGSQVSGWFALGHRVINVPIVLVSHSMGQVYAARASALARDDRLGLRRLFSRSATLLLAVGVIPFGVLALAGSTLFAVAFGRDWREAGVYVQILSVTYLCQFVVAPLSQTLNLLERQGVQTAWDAVRVAVVAVTLALSAHAGLPPRAALAIYAVGTTLSLLCLLAVASAGLARHASAAPPSPR